MNILKLFRKGDLELLDQIKIHFGNKLVKLDCIYSFKLIFQMEFNLKQIRIITEADLKTSYAIKQSIS